MKGAVEESLLESETARDRLHECGTNSVHCFVVRRDRAAPFGQHGFCGQWRRLAQRVTQIGDGGAVCNVRSQINTFLAREVARLNRKPAAVDIRVLRRKFSSPQRLQHRLLEPEYTQQIRTGRAPDGHTRRHTDDAEKSDVTGRRENRGVRSVPLGGLRMKKRADVDNRNDGIGP